MCTIFVVVYILPTADGDTACKVNNYLSSVTARLLTQHLTHSWRSLETSTTLYSLQHFQLFNNMFAAIQEAIKHWTCFMLMWGMHTAPLPSPHFALGCGRQPTRYQLPISLFHLSTMIRDQLPQHLIPWKPWRGWSWPISDLRWPASWTYCTLPNTFVEDTLLYVLQQANFHLDNAGKVVRISFFDFSSAFNTIQPRLLQDKLDMMQLHNSRIADCLTDHIFLRQRGCVYEKVASSTGVL